jgi:hypothetical protein
MPKHTGKRKSPIERKATHHQEFVGSAEPERAEAEAVKEERVAAAREQDVVHEMAEKLEQEAAKPELRIPRSVEEGKRLLDEGSEMLREKAQERLDGMARPAQKVLELGTAALSLLFAPARIGLRLVMGAVEIPAAIFHVLRRKEA